MRDLPGLYRCSVGSGSGAGCLLHTVAADLVGPGNSDPFLDEQFDDLVVVGVGSQHDGSNVRCELRELSVHHKSGDLGT